MRSLDACPETKARKTSTASPAVSASSCGGIRAQPLQLMEQSTAIRSSTRTGSPRRLTRSLRLAGRAATVSAEVGIVWSTGTAPSWTAARREVGKFTHFPFSVLLPYPGAHLYLATLHYWIHLPVFGDLQELLDGKAASWKSHWRGHLRYSRPQVAAAHLTYIHCPAQAFLWRRKLSRRPQRIQRLRERSETWQHWRFGRVK